MLLAELAAADSKAAHWAAGVVGIPMAILGLLPLGIAAFGGWVGYRSWQAMQDPPTQQYLHMLKLLYQVLSLCSRSL